MIEIKRLVFNPNHENTYIVSDETGECVIIDCGCFNASEQYMLASYIEMRNLRPKRLIATHCHLDHVCGNGFIVRRYGLKPEAHVDDAYLMGIAHYQALALGIDEEGMEMPDIDCHLKHGDRIHFGNTELVVLHTPGHSAGSMSLYCPKENKIFTGDTLMRLSMGTYRLPGGDQEQMVHSILECLFDLPYDVTVFPGHGEVTTIGYERANNQEVHKPIEKTPTHRRRFGFKK